MINNNLTKEIIKQVYLSIGVNHDNGFIMNDEFLLNQTIDFDIFSGKIWSCETKINDAKIKLLLAECSAEKQEYAFISQIDGCPLYGCYLSYSIEPNDSLISFANTDNWMICNYFLQASFLAGMDQLSQLSRSWSINSDPSDLIFKLKSFIDHHDLLNNDE